MEAVSSPSGDLCGKPPRQTAGDMLVGIYDIIIIVGTCCLSPLGRSGGEKKKTEKNSCKQQQRSGRTGVVGGKTEFIQYLPYCFTRDTCDI